MYIADIYKKGVGTLHKLGKFPTLESVKEALSQHLKDNNLHVVAIETLDSATFNYLSNGTEFDYCLED